MSDDTLLPFDLSSVRRKKLTVDFAGGNQSSAGGLLLLREAERKLGVCRRLAEAMPDRRDPDRLTAAEMRVLFAIVEIGGMPEVAHMLGISQATVKTHLQRIFGKTSRPKADSGHIEA